MAKLATFSVYDYLINSLSVIISVKVWIPASHAGMTWYPSNPFFVIPVRNTGISFHSIMVSFQCPYDVIPVWNPVFYAISSRTLCF
ncbi:MAG: hypothetical protein LBV62_03820, partial [Rickettsiales bacterium]|nr:hypothetical protein [Rickettsiales bacterium]